VNIVRKLEETGGIDVLQVKGHRHRSRTEQNLKPLLFLQQNKKKMKCDAGHRDKKRARCSTVAARPYTSALYAPATHAVHTSEVDAVARLL
jgi:hypothetical protein